MSEMPRDFEWLPFNQRAAGWDNHPLIQTASFFVSIGMVATGITCLVSLTFLTL